MKKPEILAPVGNREMLTAAVFAGADAVYLGLDSFNARRNAKNFTTESLREAVEFCHVRGVKVYLTMNTLVSDKEMEQAVEIASQIANSGDIVTLSPACASFDAFPNFEVRGRHFKELVRKL